jgi:hypothetical protein
MRRPAAAASARRSPTRLIYDGLVSNNAIEGIAVAVPAVFLAARILTGRGNSPRAKNFGWALFSIPIVTWGVLTGRPVTVLGGVAVFAIPYVIDRLFEGVWPRR